MTVPDSTCHDRLVSLDEQIRWVLENPAMTKWLKSALQSALVEDPISLANDLEILTHLLGMRTRHLSETAIAPKPDFGSAL